MDRFREQALLALSLSLGWLVARFVLPWGAAYTFYATLVYMALIYIVLRLVVWRRIE